MTRRAWEIARGYFAWPFALGVLLLMMGGRRVRRAGWGSIFVAGLVLVFFRDPERVREYAPDEVYAAADGVVREVDEVGEGGMPSGRALRISTFLSLHNVHVNRSPVAGKIVGMETVEGGYAPALFGSSEDNQRVRVSMEGEMGPVLVVPKAGLIARRITSWVREGDTVEAGERIGLIHFGSRTDVLLPLESFEPLVGPGTRVRAGITPIARHNPGGNHRTS